jgi:hypothetical protein
MQRFITSRISSAVSSSRRHVHGDALPRHRRYNLAPRTCSINCWSGFHAQGTSGMCVVVALHLAR